MISLHVSRKYTDFEASPTCCLRLVLFWYRTCDSVARATAMAFSLTATPKLYKLHTFWQHISKGVLNKHPLAKVSLPSPEELESFIHAIVNKYQVLQRERVLGSADGLKLKIFSVTKLWFVTNLELDKLGLFYIRWYVSTTSRVRLAIEGLVGSSDGSQTSSRPIDSM